MTLVSLPSFVMLRIRHEQVSSWQPDCGGEHRRVWQQGGMWNVLRDHLQGRHERRWKRMQAEPNSEGHGGGSVPRMQQEQLRSLQGSVLQNCRSGRWPHQHLSQAVSSLVMVLLNIKNILQQYSSYYFMTMCISHELSSRVLTINMCLQSK
jgi:hypothetical protein